MKEIHHLHSWDVGYHEAVALQNHLKDRLILTDTDETETVTLIAGADISYARGSRLFFAVVVVLEFPSLVPVEKASHMAEVNFPYIPGLLSFRECPPLLAAFEKLTRTPDVVLFDGHGIAHPRGIGLASHMGLILDCPAIGCAKTRLFGTHGDVPAIPGDYAPLMKDHAVIGAVLRTKKNVRPIFVSIGHRIGLSRSVDIVMKSCRGYRLPEPTRQAHLAVNELRRDYYRQSL